MTDMAPENYNYDKEWDVPNGYMERPPPWQNERFSMQPVIWHDRGDRSEFEEMTALWRELVTNYSQRSLTKRTDLFPALQCLAMGFRSFVGGRCLGGLWENDITSSLAWTTVKEAMPAIPWQ